MRRLILIAIVVLALAPGTLLRDAPRNPNIDPVLTMTALDAEGELVPGLSIEGVWELDSPNELFGGYSGLVALEDGQLLAVSDLGGWLRFAPPGSESTAPVFGSFARARLRNKHVVDAEAATYDPRTGEVWVAYEGSNSIERSDTVFASTESTRPAAMADWPSNRGAEAMTKLGDGRFLVFGEGSPEWTGAGYPALLFDGDPVDNARAESFSLMLPEGFRATDLAALPDGRVLLLLRSVENYLPPRFGMKLAIGDPGEIAPGGQWRPKIIGTLPDSVPSDNFEGLAVRGNGDGSLTLWMISDDNHAALQRTLLYRLRWDLRRKGS